MRACEEQNDRGETHLTPHRTGGMSFALSFQEVLLYSKWFSEDEQYYSLHTSSPIFGGLIGSLPLPQAPSTDTSSDSPVMKCSGLGVDWNAPTKMAEGLKTNPGEQEHSFKNVPAVLLAGSYIGSKCWPEKGVWNIEYRAPCKLYIWAREGEYNGGVDDSLKGLGWAREAAAGFQRSDGAALTLWSKHFTAGPHLSVL